MMLLRPSRFLRTINFQISAKARIHQFAHALYRGDRESFDGFAFLRHVRLRYDGVFETVLGGFAQSFLAVGDRPDFSGKADFTESDQVRW